MNHWTKVASHARELAANIDEFGKPTDGELLQYLDEAIEKAYLAEGADIDGPYVDTAIVLFDALVQLRNQHYLECIVAPPCGSCVKCMAVGAIERAKEARAEPRP